MATQQVAHARKLIEGGETAAAVSALYIALAG
jgi:hypothetical protein